MMAPATALAAARQGLGVPSLARWKVFFKPRACTRCGVLVAKRDEVSHAAVCVVTCPFERCYARAREVKWRPTRSRGGKADDLGAQDLFLETTQAAFMRSVQLLKEQARMTPVDIDFSIDATDRIRRARADLAIDSPPVMVRQGGAVMAPFRLILGFRWIVSAADARAAGDSPYGIYLLVLNQDARRPNAGQAPASAIDGVISPTKH